MERSRSILGVSSCIRAMFDEELCEGYMSIERCPVQWSCPVRLLGRYVCAMVEEELHETNMTIE